MPPFSKKLRGHICLGLSVRGTWCVMLCIRSRTVRDRIMKLDILNMYEKISGPVLFFLFCQPCRCRVMALFQCFFDFPIVSLWNLVNKISII